MTKKFKQRFELSGVFEVEADTYDEATSTVADALLDLSDLGEGVSVEVHAISMPQSEDSE